MNEEICCLTITDPPLGPRILISHIPLARPEASACGPLREGGRILKGAGPGYQNLLGSETSKFLLEVVKPSLVFRWVSIKSRLLIRLVVMTMTTASTLTAPEYAKSQSNLSPQPPGFEDRAFNSYHLFLLPPPRPRTLRLHTPTAHASFQTK